MVDLKDFDEFHSQAESKRQISIRKTGIIAFNKRAHKYYKIDEFAYVKLFFNQRTRQIAVKFLKDYEDGAVEIHKPENKSARFNLRGLFSECGIRIEESLRVYPDEFDENKNIIIFRLPRYCYKEGLDMPNEKVTWRKSVADAIMRIVARKGSPNFSRQELIDQEIDKIINETDTRGKTAEQTLSRILQELRDNHQIQFLEPGSYRVLTNKVR